MAAPGLRSRTVGIPQVQRALALLSGAEQKRLVSRGLLQAGELLKGEVKRQLTGPSGLKRRTGQLRNSIDVDASQLPRSVTVGSTDIKARIHEQGGTITPRRAKVLTIPLDAAKTGAGFQRFTAREASAAFPGGTFWRRTRSGALILFGRREREIVPLFLGVRSVTIPARPFFAPAVDAAGPKFPGIFLDLIQREVSKA